MKRRSLIISLVAIVTVAIGGVVATFVTDTTPQLGLDLQGGASVTLQPVGEADDESLTVVTDILRNRIDSLGVAEPEIIRQGNTVVVNLPGIKDQDRAIALVGQTGKVLFRPVQAETLSEEAVAAASTTTVPASTSTPPTSTVEASTSVAATSTTAAAGGSTTTTLAPEVQAQITPRTEDTPEAVVVLPGRDGTVLYTLGPAFALGEDAISTSEATVINGEWVVDLELKEGEKGLGAWNTWSAKCFNQEADCPTGGMAIVLDGTVIAAPVPQTPFFSDTSVQVSGGGSGFGKTEAKDLARVLKYGGVPVELKPQAAQTVSATLGKDSLRAGLIAGFVGVILVLLLMILYYRKLAVLVVFGLFLSGCLLWTTISILSKTSGLSLTLAGVTGIIVSIGVTVDSYVVFLERLKDEVRSGKSLRASTPRGFKSAWRTIVAADVVSLIGAGVLWYLSVGSVRGFAFFLGLSTILDLIVTYFFTRPAAILLSQGRLFRGNEVLGVRTGEALLVGSTA
ncbi:MAG TPA: protein translocase subunit SecD [Acidimicrobiales bacterium]|nr:protein translocase subunit SecD [Acidimicrobiales bacterium]